MRVTTSSTTSRPFRFDGEVYRIFRSDSTYSVRKKPKKTPSATAPCLLRSGALPTVSQPVVQRLIGRESLVYHPVDLCFLSPLLVYLLLVPVYSPRLDSRQGNPRDTHLSFALSLTVGGNLKRGILLVVLLVLQGWLIM